MKTYVMGDLHGCCDEFERLLSKMKPNLQNDRLILLGDYLDRGRKSYELIQALLRMQADYGSEKVVLLRGNHEQMALDYFSKRDSSYLYNGGQATIRSFHSHNDPLENYLKVFQQMPVYIEDEHYLYVHAGVRPGVALEEQSEGDMLWIREEFYEYPNTLGKTVIFGHTPTIYLAQVSRPVRLHNNIALDTGCVYDGWLSALEISEGTVMRIYQVQGNRSIAYPMAI